MKLGVIAAIVVGVLWFLGNDDARIAVTDWISTQADAVNSRVQELSDSTESRPPPRLPIAAVSETPRLPPRPSTSPPGLPNAAVSETPRLPPRPSTSPPGLPNVAVSETPRLPPRSSTLPNERPSEPSLRYPGEGPLDRRDVEKWIVLFTNAVRQRADLDPFVYDPDISAIARAHSEKMVRFGLTHVIQGKDPTDRALAAGYDCRAFRGDGSYSYGLSENVAEHPRVTEWSGVGFSGGPTTWRPVEFDSDSRAMALGLVEGWMESPGHRANILDREARKIGVGVAITEAPENGWTHETVFATQNFSACR